MASCSTNSCRRSLTGGQTATVAPSKTVSVCSLKPSMPFALSGPRTCLSSFASPPLTGPTAVGTSINPSRSLASSSSTASTSSTSPQGAMSLEPPFPPAPDIRFRSLNESAVKRTSPQRQSARSPRPPRRTRSSVTGRPTWFCSPDRCSATLIGRSTLPRSSALASHGLLNISVLPSPPALVANPRGLVLDCSLQGGVEELLYAALLRGPLPPRSPFPIGRSWSEERNE